MGLKTLYYKLKAKYYGIKSRLASPTYYFDKHSKKIDISTQIPGFSTLAAQIISEQRTFLSYDRLYTLYQAVLQSPAQGDALEVGVYQGGSSKFLAKLLSQREQTLYSCDTFTSHSVVDSRYDGEHQVGQGFTNVSLDSIKSYLGNIQNIRLVPGDIYQTFKTMQLKSLSFVHCDVDVYPVTLFVLETAAPLLNPGGIIVVDDYGFTTCKGAKVAVDEFMQANTNFSCFHLLSGQALLVKR